MDVGYGSLCKVRYGSGYGSWSMDRVWARDLDPCLVFLPAPIYVSSILPTTETPPINKNRNAFAILYFLSGYNCVFHCGNGKSIGE